MNYVYLAIEWDAQLDKLEVRCAYTKRYELETWLKEEFRKKTTLGHLKCYRIRGAVVTEIDPYETIKTDPGEL